MKAKSACGFQLRNEKTSNHRLNEDGNTCNCTRQSRRDAELSVVYRREDILAHLSSLIGDDQVGGRSKQDEVSGERADPGYEHPVIPGNDTGLHCVLDVALDQQDQRDVRDDV